MDGPIQFILSEVIQKYTLYTFSLFCFPCPILSGVNMQPGNEEYKNLS